MPAGGACSKIDALRKEGATHCDTRTGMLSGSGVALFAMDGGDVDGCSQLPEDNSVAAQT